MLLRAFSSGAVALSGVEAVSNGVPAFKKPESEQRGDDARRRWASSSAPASSACRCWPPTSSPYRGDERPDRHRPDGRVHLRRQGRPVLDHADRHLRHPDPGRQHRLRRLPAAVVDHRPRRLPAPPVRQPRRPAGVLQRRHLPRRRGRRADRRLQGRHLGADPAVRRSACSPGSRSARPGWSCHHCRLREPRWRARRCRSTASACVATGLVALVVVVSKFTEGAWIPAVADPELVVAASARSAGTTSRVRGAVRGRPPATSRRGTPTSSSCSSARVHRGVLEAVQYARSLAPERLIAVSVVTDAEEQEQLVDGSGTTFGMPIELHTISSPYRELTRPVLDYLDELDAESPDDIITVVIPEFVTPWKHAVAAQPVGVRPQGPAAVPAEHRRHVGAGARSTAIRPALTSRRRGLREIAAGGRRFGQNDGDASESRTRSPTRTPTSSTCARATGCGPPSICPTSPRAPRARSSSPTASTGSATACRFTDGTELADLDQRTIEPIGRAAKRLAKAAAKA